MYRDGPEMTPALAFETHTSYVEWRSTRPDEDRLLHDGYWRAINDENNVPVSARDIENSMRRSRSYHNVATVIDDIALARADTVFLSDDLRELVWTAEATMPDEVLFDTDVYTPCGLVVMETPLTARVPSWCLAEDADLLIRSAVNRGGDVAGERRYAEPEKGKYLCYENWEIRAYLWADEQSIDEACSAEVARKYGKDSEQCEIFRYGFSGGNPDTRGIHVRVYGVVKSTEVDGVTVTIPRFSLAPLRLMDQFTFCYGEEYESGEGPQYELNDEATDCERYMFDDSGRRHTQARRFLVALLRLMEEYVDIDRSPSARPASRRATRSGRTGDTRATTVLSLRRTMYESDGSPSGRKVTLAHLVRGHWRNQWYPSQKKHRAKWIRPHRRGGAPTDDVIAKPRVIRVDR